MPHRVSRMRWKRSWRTQTIWLLCIEGISLGVSPRQCTLGRLAEHSLSSIKVDDNHSPHLSSESPKMRERRRSTYYDTRQWHDDAVQWGLQPPKTKYLLMTFSYSERRPPLLEWLYLQENLLAQHSSLLRVALQTADHWWPIWGCQCWIAQEQLSLSQRLQSSFWSCQELW